MRSNTACLVAIIFVSLSSSAQDIGNRLKWGRPAYPRGGACFFQRQNYGGDYFCMSIGQTASSLPRGVNDRISSARIFGNATVTLYNDRNFGGIRLPLARNIADLRNIPARDNPSKNWNNRISSITVRRR